MRLRRFAGITSLLVTMTMIGALETPRIELDPRRAVPGQSVRVRSDGFAQDGIIDVYIDDVDRVVARADDAGSIDVGLELPSDLSLGVHWLTAIERVSDRALQTRLLVDASTTWPQLGGDPGRTGHAIPGPGLSTALVGDLREVWNRDLEVLEPGEEIFVTDVAEEVAIPAIVDGPLLVSTWYATDVMNETEIVRRVAITATDVVTGRVRWRRVAESASFGALSFGTPVLSAGTVVARWEGDRVLLGFDPATGALRWRRPAAERERFSDLLAMGGRIVVPVDRPRGADDALLAFDPATGRIVWEGSMPAGSDWRLAAGEDLVVAAGTPGRVVGIDASDGTLLWTRHLPIGWWGGPLVADGSVFMPTLEGDSVTVTALRLANGRQRWTWNPWPAGTCGPGCEILSAQAEPAAAAGGTVLVRATAAYCPPDRPTFECDVSPSHRSWLTALDLPTGRERWNRRFEATGGDVSISDDVALIAVGSGLRLLDLRSGEELMAVPPPVHKDTYGVQQTWAGQTIPTGSGLLVGAADGTVTAFSVATRTARPRPRALQPDPTLPVPPPAGAVVPTTTPAPAPDRRAGAPWAVVAIAAAMATLLGGALLAALLVKRRRQGRGRTTLDEDPTPKVNQRASRSR